MTNPKIIFLFLSLFWAVSSFSDEHEGIYSFPSERTVKQKADFRYIAKVSIFPTGTAIKQNSIFIITYPDNDFILKLNNGYNIYLKTSGKIVKLLIKETYLGVDKAQALVKPETTLEPGLTYTLCIDSIPSENYIPVRYTVLAVSDTISPVVEQKTKLVNKVFKHNNTLGYSNNSLYVEFDFHVSDSSEVMVKTTVKNRKTGLENTIFLLPIGGKIYLGKRDYFSYFSDFDLSDGKYYEVEFSYMDASGNLTPWVGERMAFSKPFDWELEFLTPKYLYFGYLLEKRNSFELGLRILSLGRKNNQFNLVAGASIFKQQKVAYVSPELMLRYENHLKNYHQFAIVTSLAYRTTKVLSLREQTITPELGISFYGFSITYGYNIPISNSQLAIFSPHRVAFRLLLF